jgi:hypothetical protein
MQLRIIIIALIFLQSCSTISIGTPKEIDCREMNKELNLRYSLFNKLTAKEIKKRRKISVTTFSPLDQLSVFSQIYKAAESAPQNARMLAVDLRYYQSVNLGNIVISNVVRDNFLPLVMKNSKHSQGSFALINFNSESVSLFPPSMAEIFPKTKINRGDLEDVEVVINVSNSGDIEGNIKIAPDQKISIIADHITKPYRLDMREYSNLQYHLNDKWIMSVYSIENNDLQGGKDTTGFFKLVNNKATKNIKLDRFDRSLVSCYTDISGPKF